MSMCACMSIMSAPSLAQTCMVAPRAMGFLLPLPPVLNPLLVLS